MFECGLIMLDQVYGNIYVLLQCSQSTLLGSVVREAVCMASCGMLERGCGREVDVGVAVFGMSVGHGELKSEWCWRSRGKW